MYEGLIIKAVLVVLATAALLTLAWFLAWATIA